MLLWVILRAMKAWYEPEDVSVFYKQHQLNTITAKVQTLYDMEIA